MHSIMITNDDGITSDGIIRLAEEAVKHGEVWVIAPLHERSAASHSITLRDHIDVYPHDFPVKGVHAFAASGTPADCVRVGVHSILPFFPDVVLSGINYGYNTASDLQYSATAGAAFEASFQGSVGIALSEAGHACHEVTDHYLPEILAMLLRRAVPSGQILNVNFPGCPLSQCKGILEDRLVSKGTFYHDRYKKIADLEGGGVRLMIDGLYNEEAEEGTDFRAIVDNYISIGTVHNIS